VKIRIFKTEDQLATALARGIVDKLRENPRLVLGLATGRTPLPLYRALAALHKRGLSDYAKATTFNLDEFVGLDPAHPGSYRAYMREQLFQHIDLSPRRIHFLDGRAPDLEAECARFENSILKAGGIDLQILGIGANGHIGFNEPAPALSPWSHRVKLTLASRKANAGFFGGKLRDVPREALSMGVATIMHARSIVLMATGSEKAEVIAKTVTGPITTRVPASLLQLHHEVEIWLDEEAASKLRREGLVTRRGGRLHER
jgi:glucosamine-6-phosphate deaminase